MIYFMQPVEGGPVKIGYSKDVQARHRALELHYSKPLAILATMEGGIKEERAIHARFAHLRLGGPKPKGARIEQFQPAPDLMEFIRRPLLAAPKHEAVEPMPGRERAIVNVTGTFEWAAWLQRLAFHVRSNVPHTIDRALVYYAQAEGFTEPAPVRNPR